MLLIAKNIKNQIIEFDDGYCFEYNLTEIISIPNHIKILYCYNNQLTSLPNLPENLQHLSCENNNIKQLPNLRDNLVNVWCDMCCFEDYMLEMKNTNFYFYC